MFTHPKLTTRPLTHDDVDRVFAVVAAAESVSSIPIVTTRSDIKNEFAEPLQELNNDSIAYGDERDQIVAYILTEIRAEPTRENVAHVHGRVHPDWHRRGLGGSLIAWGVARCRARLAESPSTLPQAIRTYIYEEDVAALAAFEGAGFTPERYYIELEADLAKPTPDVSSPAEITIVPWTDERADEIRAAHNSAFLDHWGSEPLSEERWKRWLSLHEGFLPKASFVALADGAVVGYAMNGSFPEEWDQLGYSCGWVNALGTTRTWRKRTHHRDARCLS
jgi:mycothiol synthase